jgi:hypothetical protein
MGVVAVGDCAGRVEVAVPFTVTPGHAVHYIPQPHVLSRRLQPREDPVHHRAGFPDQGFAEGDLALGRRFGDEG